MTSLAGRIKDMPMATYLGLTRSYNRALIIFLLFIATVGYTPAVAQTNQPNDLEALYQQIDNAIEHWPQYVAKLEHKIADCRDSLTEEKNAEKSIQIAERLYLLYQPYRNDSALHYAEICINLAKSLQRPDLVGRFSSILAYQCSQANMFTEAIEQLRQIDRASLDDAGLLSYYVAWMHVSGELASYTQREEVRQRYFDLQNLYRDSILMVAKEGSSKWFHLKMDILSGRQLYQDALSLNDKWLNIITENTHEEAYAAFYRSMVYNKLGNHDMTCYWLGKSALGDIKNAVTNQASLLFLAEHLANDGDIDRARRYVEFSKDCNIAFCPFMRAYQINSVINVIEKSDDVAKQRYNLMLIIASVVTVLFLLTLIYTVILIRRKAASSVPAGRQVLRD